jgi:hypothetical protein
MEETYIITGWKEEGGCLCSHQAEFTGEPATSFEATARLYEVGKKMLLNKVFGEDASGALHCVFLWRNFVPIYPLIDQKN